VLKQFLKLRDHITYYATCCVSRLWNSLPQKLLPVSQVSERRGYHSNIKEAKTLFFLAVVRLTKIFS